LASLKSTPLQALMAATIALPIGAVPVQVAAQTTQSESASSAFVPVGTVAGIRSLWYREDAGRMRVTEPVAWFKLPVGERWEWGASATVDMVSGASPQIVSNLSGKPTQILTGASITDRRKAYDTNLTRKYGALNEHTLGVSFARSDEEDYESKAYGLNATFDFNERNTTLALGLGRRDDVVMSVTNRSLRADRDVNEVLVGVTQLIDRNTIIQSNLTHTRQRGYLSDPYKLTLTRFTTVGPPGPPFALVGDTRPDSRASWAWLTRGKRALPTVGAVVSAEYRYYRDDWGVRAHTLAGSWLQRVDDTFSVDLGLRYYTQSKANFYRQQLVRPLPTYTSSDQRLATFGALEPSAKLIARLSDAATLDVGVSRYRQRGQWRTGGKVADGEVFEPLSATLINVGLVWRF
jgi:hypothetical protein